MEVLGRISDEKTIQEFNDFYKNRYDLNDKCCCETCGGIIGFEMADKALKRRTDDKENIDIFLNCPVCDSEIKIQNSNKRYKMALYYNSHNINNQKNGCNFADSDGEGRYICSETGDHCMFLSPNAKSCYETYGEGPLAFTEKTNIECIKGICKAICAEAISSAYHVDNLLRNLISKEYADETQVSIINMMLKEETEKLINNDPSTRVLYTDSKEIEEYIDFLYDLGANINIVQEPYSAEIKWEAGDFVNIKLQYDKQQESEKEEVEGES